MYRRTFPQRVLGVAMAVVLLVGCGAPRSEPAPASLSPAPPQSLQTEHQVQFAADRSDFEPGEVTTLHWRVQGGAGVGIDEQPVDILGQKQVRPPETAQYTLDVATCVTMLYRQVSVAVTPPEPGFYPRPVMVRFSDPLQPAQVDEGGSLGPNPLWLPLVVCGYVPYPSGTPTLEPSAQDGWPDLTVVDVGFTPAAPNTGEELVIHALIRNQGRSDAVDFLVRFLADEARVVSLIGDRLSPGAEMVVEARVASLAAGEHTIRVIANPGNWIQERDLTNNELRAVIMVSAAALPDLVIESLTVSPVSPSPGQAVAITVAVRNRGTSPAEQVDVALSMVDVALLEGLQQVDCGPHHPYAVEVVQYAPGPGANPDLRNPSAALGPPDFSGEPAHALVSLGTGGSITLALPDRGVIDRPGNDLRIWGHPGQERPLVLEVSADGQLYHSFGLQRAATELDLAAIGVTAAWFVRMTDAGTPSPQGTDQPSAELDAVEALHCLPLDQDPFKLDRVEVLVSLAPGEVRTVTVSWPATSAAHYTLIAEVDALDSVREMDEANNRIERPVIVKE